MAANVPIVDLSGSQDEVVKLIRHACTTSGFFVVSHHGVPADVTRQCFEQNQRFFALPDDQKSQIRVNRLNR